MPDADSTPIKPILKWVGGKRLLVPKILPYVPEEYGTYVEPFVGGAAMLLSLLPKRGIINDSNPELINVYRVVRDSPSELIDALRVHQSRNTKEYYYEIRSLDRDADYAKKASPVNRAARILYLNKVCFNGLFRVNSKGQINIAYGGYENPNITNEEEILALSRYLQGDIDIRQGDYAAVLDGISSDSFVYLDPPYMPISRSSAFTSYTKGGFGYDEQVRLRNKCKDMRLRSIPFVESNSDCDGIRELYEGFTIVNITAKRSVGAKSSSRKNVGEVLIMP